MSALVTLKHLSEEIADHGVTEHIREHLRNGCPLEPLVDAVVTLDEASKHETVAAMVARARELIAARNELGGIDPHEEKTEERVKEPARGRPKSLDRAARQAVAKEHGVSEETVRRRLKAEQEPVEAEVVARIRNVTMDAKLGEAHRLLSEARAILEPIKRDIEKLRDGLDRKDGRWALLGAVAQASNSAQVAAERVAQARAYRDDMERGKHNGSSKRPIGAYETALGRDAYESVSRAPERSPNDPEALARGEQWRFRTDQETAEALEESRRIAQSQAVARKAVSASIPGLSEAPRTLLRPPERRVRVTDPTGKVLAEGVHSGEVSQEQIAEDIEEVF